MLNNYLRVCVIIIDHFSLLHVLEDGYLGTVTKVIRDCKMEGVGISNHAEQMQIEAFDEQAVRSDALFADQSSLFDTLLWASQPWP